MKDEGRIDPQTHQSPAGGLEIEVVGEMRAGPGARDLRSIIDRAVRETLKAAPLQNGHVAVALVSAAEIRRLNRDHRGRDRPTDVLSFPIDEDGAAAGPRELGDVVICPEHTEDLERAAVHGVLHLLGHDHETDAGEMLAQEDRVMAVLR